MNESRLAYLFHTYFAKSASIEERDELMGLLRQAENDEQVKDLLEQKWRDFNSHSQLFSDSQGDKMLANILRKETASINIPVITSHRRPLGWMRIAAAAAILFFVVTGVYFWLKPKQNLRSIAQSAKVSPDIKEAIVPGGSKAVLTLADGSSIVLDSSQRGILAKQGNTKIRKLNTCTLSYEASDKDSLEVVYNTLTIPRGGQYQLILPDGSKVWLNASSSIYFPTVFSGKERKVTVTGEAYFEVAKNASMPFKISAKGTEVQVFGTHFNIMAYGDESSVNTTLLEGSVKVSSGSLKKLLVPGEQSRINKTGGISIVEPDIEEVMAWKNGWFQFNAFDIETVMRQISRWYNVEVFYEGEIPTGHFTGLVRRNNEISQVLKIMEAAGVRFKIAGRRVVVLSQG